MTDPDPAARPSEPPPRTGVPSIDEAVASVSALSPDSLAEHHHRLASAHAVLQEALNSDVFPASPPPS